MSNFKLELKEYSDFGLGQLSKWVVLLLTWFDDLLAKLCYFVFVIP